MEYYFRKQLLLSLIIYAGQMLDGFGMGWTAPIIPILQDPGQTPLPDVITEGQASWIGSLLFFSILGPHVSGYLSNIKGRKPCLFLGGVLVLASFVVLALARNLSMIYAGRIIKGLGTGIISVMNLVYIGEIASTNIRGIFLTGTGIFNTIGTLLVYSIGPYVPYAVTCYVGMTITVFYLAGLFLIPETPIFLIMKGREEEARETLTALGRKHDIHLLITPKLSKKETQQPKWTELFTVKSNRKAFFITFTIIIFQQLSGVVVVIFFVTRIFQLAESSIEPNIATIIIGVTQLVASSITPLFVERVGRKLILLVSTGFCFLSLAIFGLYFFLDYREMAIIQSIQWLPIFILITFFFSYNAGLGIIPGTLSGEMFHGNVRSIGSAITLTSGWLFGFGMSTAFGYMIEGIGAHFTFWIFSAACAVAFVFTAVFVPETRGKSFLEIQEILSR